MSDNSGTYNYFRARDGLSIRYGFWSHGGKDAVGTVVLLTGRREFLEKYAETINELHQRRFDVFGMDWRGQGLSGRLLKNRHKGHVDDYEQYLGDLTDLIEKIIKPETAAPLTILAHSMGAHIALRYLHNHPETIERAVLTSPMVDIRQPFFSRRLLQRIVRLAVRMGLADAYPIGAGDYKVPEQLFKGNRLTSDPHRFEIEQRAVAQNPDLALGGVTYGWLDATFRSIEILMAPGVASRITTPVLLLSAEKDRIVSNHAQQLISSRIPMCTLKTIPGARHEILSESDSIRATFWREVDRFLDVHNITGLKN